MSDESAFLAAIEAAPDAELEILEYADSGGDSYLDMVDAMRDELLRGMGIPASLTGDGGAG